MKLGARWYIYGGLVTAIALVTGGALLLPTTTAKFASKSMSHDPVRVDGQPIADVLKDSADPLENSKWLRARTQRYRSLLSDWHCDTLVLPVQVEQAGFNMSMRMLMTGEVALQLRQPDHCVVDPYLVDMALGEGLRRYSPQAIKSLAHDLGARTVVSTFAGHHDSYAQMRVSMIVETFDEKGETTHTARHSVDKLKYGADVSPFDIFRTKLPELFAAVGLPTQPPQPRPAGKLSAELPQAPENLLSASDAAPITQSAQLVLLGMLAPWEAHAAERLFTKAWFALAGTDANDPNVQRMRARILFHLYQRPYALAQIKDTQGWEADGLRAVLNGNLPQAQAAFAQMSEPWERAFLALEIYDLEKTYDKKADATAAEFIGALGPSWGTLASAKLNDRNAWSEPDPLALKRLLDRVFPIVGQSLTQTLTGNAVIGQFDDPSVYDLLALKHVHTLLEKRTFNFCCKSFDVSPNAADVLDLLDSRVEAAMWARTDYLEQIQGLPVEARKQLEQYDSELAGQPDQEWMRARICRSLLANAPRDKQDDLLNTERSAARIAATTWQGQYTSVFNSLWILSQLDDRTEGNLRSAYSKDYPPSANWSIYSPDHLLFTSSDARAVRLTSPARQAIFAERFIGSPLAAKMKMDDATGEANDPEAIRAAIQQDPANWTLYETLFEYLVKRGAYADAANAALSFPDFKRPENAANSVELANRAWDVGRRLYFRGAAEESRPLLKIAADTNNGSAASIRSRAHLAVLDKKYSHAALAFLESARRYASLGDYRDYLSLLFAIGDSRDGWPGFGQLIQREHGAQPWSAAMVGHRREKTQPSELRKWLKEQAEVEGQDRDALTNYAVMEQMTDRGAPPEDFVTFIRELAGPSHVDIVSDGTRFQGAFGNKTAHLVGPSGFAFEFHWQKNPLARPRFPDGFVVPNRYALFADAYMKLRKKDFEQSAVAFRDLASFYDIERMDEWGFALPYFALAAVQSGDKLKLEKYVIDNIEQLKYFESLPNPDQWGTYLAGAIFSGSHGQYDDSLKWLDKVLLDMPATGYWPVTAAYEYAEVCNQLFELTHDERYKQRTLDWARALRKIEPTDSWAHALVARLSSNEAERIEALAWALYLDPQSTWIEPLPTQMKDRAAKWSEQHPVFRPEQSETNARTL